MMMMPSIFGGNLFNDDWMDFSFPDIDKELYGKHAKNLMKTDVKEKDGNYEVAIDLPGFKKDEITAELKDGYLTISAAKGLDKDEKDKEGKYIRRERYAGNMSRSFYVGKDITEKDIPVSIYQCEGAKTCAIELCSFSKTAGFTGLRLAYTVIPKELKCGDVQLHALWARRHGTKYNGAPYIIQRAGEAVYSEAGKAQIAEQIAYYHKNASYIFNGLKEAGYTVAGGVNSPYVWLKTPKQMNSWEFFDYLLEKANVVGTPGSGFGPSGEGYFRLTAFGTYENTVKAIDRIKKL